MQSLVQQYKLCSYKYLFRYSRNLDHLLSWRLLLPESVKEAVISFQSSNKDHNGTVLFLHQHVPQLRYHNPDVKFVFNDKSPVDCNITFHHKDGSSQSLDTTNLSHTQVKQKLTLEMGSSPETEDTS